MKDKWPLENNLPIDQFLFMATYDIWRTENINERKALLPFFENNLSVSFTSFKYLV